MRLFRSVFDGGASSYHGLRGVTGSVLILSRIRVLPANFLQPVISTLRTCRRVFKISMLFAATDRPMLDNLVRKAGPGTSFGKVRRVGRVVPRRFTLRSRLHHIGLSVSSAKGACSRVTTGISRCGGILYVIGAHGSTGRLCSHLPGSKIGLRLSEVVYPTRLRRAVNGVGALLGSRSRPVIEIVTARLIRTNISVSFPIIFHRRTKLSSMLRTTKQYGQRKQDTVKRAFIFDLTTRGQGLFNSVTSSGGTQLGLPRSDS